ncbi:MAG TPA: sugar phosphate isomerase/epimerase [Planctomycetaceae bacterium]|nr:sugar phosphate isomerase/epimerase [Planctomycetaceae bacterium]
MKLSISCRIAESFLSKEVPSMSLEDLADLAVASGYDGICMRASQVGVHSPSEDVERARAILDERGLDVTMLTGDFATVYNNDQGPECLRKIDPYLDLAETLGAPMLRVCLRTQDDIVAAQTAADKAADRGLKLVHQCHATSLFETVDGIVDTLEKIARPNFGLIFEAGNLDECGEPYGTEVIKRLAPWIFNVYLQNQRVDENGSVTLETWVRGPVTLRIMQIPEAGGIDFDAVFHGLSQIGYNGTISVHQAGPEEGTMSATEAAQQTANFLREKIAAANL